MKYLSLICLASLLFLCDHVGKAQVSYPALLDSQFDSSDTETAMHLTLLRPFGAATPGPGVSWEGRDELTVHTNKGKEGLLEDFHANGSIVFLRLPLGHSSHSPLLVLRRQTMDTGAVDNESNDALHFRGRLRRPEIQFLWPISPQALAYAAYRRTDYDVNGTTRLYENLFTIFPSTPPFQYDGRERLELAGLRYSLSSAWTLEFVGGRQSEPSRLMLTQDNLPTQVTLPLRDAGYTSLLAVRRRLSAVSDVSAYVGRNRLAGTDAVLREGSRTIGNATTTHRESSAGVGWLRVLSPRRRLGIYGEVTRDNWETQGVVPNPGELQNNYPLTSDLHYDARYTAAKRALGVSWNQSYGGGQELHGNLQFLTLDLHAKADYTVRYLFLAKSGQTSYNQSALRALLLRGDYAFPIKSLRVALEASQLIPLGTNTSAASVVSTSSDPNRRVTTGGWALNLKIERPF